MLQNVWYIKNKKGESQGRGKILTKYYSTRRKLTKAGLLCNKITHVTDDSKFVLKVVYNLLYIYIYLLENNI